MTATWPLRPNWRSSYSVTYSFKTEIIVSRSGREQRRALRSTPRKSVNFLVTAAADRFRALKRVLGTQQGHLLALPEVTTGQATTAVSAGGSAVFQLEAVPAWMVEGEPIVLVDGDRSELRTIDSITSTTVTFDAVNATAWPAGTKLCHGLLGRLDDDQQGTQPVAGIVEAKIGFNVDPGSETPRLLAEPAVTFNGREVFLLPADWAKANDLNFQAVIESVDYGFGVAQTFLPVDFGTEIRTALYLALNRATAAELLAFFERAKGRRGEFYAPTDEPDVALSEEVGGGTMLLQVAGRDFFDAYADDPVRQALSFRLRDGTRFYRTVANITFNAGSGQSVIQLVAPLAEGVTPADTISWLPVMRCASDDLTIEWLTDQVARARLSFQTLEALPAET